MKKKVMALCVCIASFAVVTAWAHTYNETNDVIYAALDRAAFYYDDLLEGSPPDNDPPPTTWRGFLGADTNGWTLAGKMAAFDWYLSTLATNDCETLDDFDRLYARVAVGNCKWFNYTNSVSTMKTLALNPHGICRDDAISIAVNLSDVNDETTDFVETIITNVLGYTRIERGVACGAYSTKLMSLDSTNDTIKAQRSRAVTMLYRHRLCGLAGVNMLDDLFACRIEGYATSSNRLDFAIFVLQHPEVQSFNIQKFISVTNQLLSSGQPLPWINVGGSGN